MNRRSFLKTTILSSLATGVTFCNQPEDKTHTLTLSFDDGFRKSFLKIADIYEDYGLKACLNVIASGHLPTFQQVDDWIRPELMGDFDDWNNLKKRGHEVMPHSWKHLNLAKQPPAEAKALITQCLDYFQENLEGYEPANAVFNFPFNASTPELEQFTLTKVRAVRTGGKGPVNPVPSTKQPVVLSCASKGPVNIDNWVEQTVNDFLDSSGGWLILNLHGLENEGWGPISTTFLINLLKQLIKIGHLEIMPTGEVLKRSLAS